MSDDRIDVDLCVLREFIEEFRRSNEQLEQFFDDLNQMVRAAHETWDDARYELFESDAKEIDSAGREYLAFARDTAIRLDAKAEAIADYLSFAN